MDALKGVDAGCVFRRFSRQWNVSAACSVGFLFLAVVSPVAAQQLQEFQLAVANSEPRGITVGSDGNLWFTQKSSGQIGRITPTGTITEFALPSADSGPYDIVTGPNGNLWFTETDANMIGQITATAPNTVTEFPVPTAASQPCDITVGPDGNLWFVECHGGVIGRITPTGDVTEFALPAAHEANDVTIGPDGNLWITELTLDRVAWLTLPSPGAPTDLKAHGSPLKITSGPDGNLWFTEAIGNQVGRVTPLGVLVEFPVPTENAFPNDITTGPDGNIWFTERVANQIGRVTPTGAITEFPAHDGPGAIVAGPDGNLWFTERYGNRIGRLTPPPLPKCATIPQDGCRKQAKPEQGLLQLTNKAGKPKDKLAWKWLKGDATPVTDFGDPLNTTSYALCVYDDTVDTPSLVASIAAPPGGMCKGKPCWKKTGTKKKLTGFKYTTAKGVLKIVLHAGTAGKAKITVTNAASNLPLPALPFHQSPKVTVQLVNSEGVCWDADYSASPLKNDNTQFKDKGD